MSRETDFYDSCVNYPGEGGDNYKDCVEISKEVGCKYRMCDESNQEYSIYGEYDDEFQNQVDYYLEHDRRTFCYYDFHTGAPSFQQERSFYRALVHALRLSGYMIYQTHETFPPVYSAMDRESFVEYMKTSAFGSLNPCK